MNKKPFIIIKIFKSDKFLNNSFQFRTIILSVFILLLPFKLFPVDNNQKNINSLFSHYYNSTYNKQSDDVSVKQDNLSLKQSEFMYADQNRFTITGDLPTYDNDIKTVPTVIVTTAVAGVFFLQHYYQAQTIWKDQGSFKVFEDGKYALYADKAGHIFGSYFTSYLARETLIPMGFSWEWSNIIGTFLGLGYATYVEILDGYGVNWGFSPSDFYADVAGAGLFIGQYYVPFLQNFTPKFQYIPAEWHGDKRRVPSDMFIDDYSSHTLWISVNVHNLLPRDLKEYWPSWLELSFGYAARNLCAPGYDCDPNLPVYNDESGNPIVYGEPKFIIALDYNLVKILPDGGSFFNWLKQSVNQFKLPSPAIEFGRTTKFYLIYPFKL